MHNPLNELIQPCIDIAKNAGNIIFDIYKDGTNINITLKEDKTPITRADLAAHDFIVARLKQLTPDIPILSEEDAGIDFAVRRNWQTYWLIDPLDGTKEFINRTGDFTVNIALIHQGHAILGVIYAPVLEVCYFAYQNAGTFRQQGIQTPEKIHTVKADENHLRITLSRRHSVELANAFIEKMLCHVKIPTGSSLKSCLIAEGKADAYPCFGKTSEWDMGAAQCIIEEAGGAMTDLNFQTLKFNQTPSLLNPPLLVVGDTVYNWKKYLDGNDYGK